MFGSLLGTLAKFRQEESFLKDKVIIPDFKIHRFLFLNYLF